MKKMIRANSNPFDSVNLVTTLKTGLEKRLDETHSITYNSRYDQICISDVDDADYIKYELPSVLYASGYDSYTSDTLPYVAAIAGETFVPLYVDCYEDADGFTDCYIDINYSEKGNILFEDWYNDYEGD